ncbi:Hypothetical protein PBC10988_39300 [Planctomycetales bacterium 10988]|nr:Hypothetical protein PBC10988_39300 [Planctomycetales bacterium 10988]
MFKTTASFAMLLSIGLFGMAGCTVETPGTSDHASTEEHDDHDHAHPSEGPHHGELIELGNEEYHAELVLDEEKGTVTVYILDGSASEAVPIEATEITINAKHDGKPEQFKLSASADENDPEGKSSRFVSESSELLTHLHEEEAEPRLVLTIEGKSYRGEVAHDHGHNHDHDHDHEEDHGEEASY